MTADRKLSGPGVNAKGDAVRHFDRSGKLIGSAISNSTVVPRWRESQGYLIATADHIGWYAPIRGPGTYVELSPDLTVCKVYSGAPNAKRPGTGLYNHQIR